MKQQPVYTFAKWQVKEGALEIVLNLLPELIEKSAGEEGNLVYEIHQSLADNHTLLLFEGYKNDTALNMHRGSAHFQYVVVRQIIPLLENREVQITHKLFPV